MTPVPAHLLDPVTTAGCFASRSALGLLHLPDVPETESTPSPRVRTPSFANAPTNAEFLAWDIVDGWGCAVLSASDPPASGDTFMKLRESCAGARLTLSRFQTGCCA
jgi:hypothetical protein